MVIEGLCEELAAAGCCLLERRDLVLRRLTGASQSRFGHRLAMVEWRPMSNSAGQQGLAALAESSGRIPLESEVLALAPLE